MKNKDTRNHVQTKTNTQWWERRRRRREKNIYK